MKPPLPPLSAAALASLLAARAAAAELTPEDLATYGLTLDQFQSVRRSESPADFGGLPSQDETDQLWLDAASFEYDVATSHASDKASTSPGFHPYLVCSMSPGLSGNQREGQVNAMFKDTPGVESSHFYANPNLYINNDTLSCGTLRAFNDTIAKVYVANPDAKEWMKVNPLHPSMKMAEYTVDTMETWFDEEEVADDVVSISGGGAPNDNQIRVQVLGLHMLLCPGVQWFDEDQDQDMEDISDDQIAEEVKNFVTENGGETAAEVSFYHHRVGGMDGPDALYTERMALWNAHLANVTSWTKDDGSNACLDTVIADHMLWIVKDKVLEVTAGLSFKEATLLMEEMGYEQWQMENCLAYMTYALALSPQVCTLEPRTRVRTLCKDGTSDLSKCPPPAVEDPNSARGRAGSLWRFVASMAGAALLSVTL
ncbi:hypothetical protein ACHAXT_006544 [Thalassiosira profunda]